MKKLVQNPKGVLCIKRVTSLTCIICAIIFAVVDKDTTTVLAFLSAGFGSNALTLKE
jgi:hypothetical protein